MNLIDFLLKLQIPAWLVLIVAVVSGLVVAHYKFFIAVKMKKLDQLLKEEITKREKILELIQERFRDRLNALRKINKPLMEFHHAIFLINEGKSTFKKYILL
jgi:uncharacterized membrane protein (DUF106 family)